MILIEDVLALVLTSVEANVLGIRAGAVVVTRKQRQAHGRSQSQRHTRLVGHREDLHVVVKRTIYSNRCLTTLTAVRNGPFVANGVLLLELLVVDAVVVVLVVVQVTSLHSLLTHLTLKQERENCTCL